MDEVSYNLVQNFAHFVAEKSQTLGVAGTKAEDNALQEHQRWMAQEVLSEITGLAPSHSKELLGLFVSELFLSVAEKERREERRQRQAEGIATAKARGVRFGPEPKPVPENFIECYEAWRDGYLSTIQGAERGISRRAFYRVAKRQEQAAERGA